MRMINSHEKTPFYCVIIYWSETFINILAISHYSIRSLVLFVYKMYCDAYCKGEKEEINCKTYSSDELEKCIKSCLDCRSPNKKYCHCPSIFPPKHGQSRGLTQRSQHGLTPDLEDYDHETGGHRNAYAKPYMTKGADGVIHEQTIEQVEEESVLTVSILLGVAFVCVVICVAIFCFFRYKRMNAAAASKDKSGAAEEDKATKEDVGVQPPPPNINDEI